MEVILTHNNADFDAAASMLGASKLHPQAVPVLPQRLSRNVAEFMALYRNGLPFTPWDDFKRTRVTRLIVTDTQSPPALRGIRAGTPTLIYEHHPPERDFGPHESAHFETLGAISTYFVERIQAENLPLTTLEATLLALGVYADTGMLTYSSTTPRDIRAAAWLLERGAVLDTVRRFLIVPLNDAQQTLMAQLLRAPETRTIQGYNVILCMARQDHIVDGMNAVAARLMDMLDPHALCLLVETPQAIQFVGRSQDDAVHLGRLAQRWGGGGHARAAAASIVGTDPETVREQLWAYLQDHIQPAVRVADLMSHGVLTVNANELVRDAIHRLRKIGHEGYPVIEDGRVVGLLTLRDADRAVEHGLNKATLRDIMQRGEWHVRPQDSVFALEQRMVESRWGQIPVIDDEGHLLGIVTRTDLIKHWARTHPSDAPPPLTISRAQLTSVLGHDLAKLIAQVAQQAQTQRLALYLVGGAVRDFFLNVASTDIDFVVEGDAIRFGQSLQAAYGGKLNSFTPFGTVKWWITDEVTDSLGLDAAHVPRHVDFVTARHEFYEHPTALPTTYSSNVKRDLERRDFTINTLAIQLSPSNASWRVLDFFGGLNDLENKRIRVLHSLSFVDDPTRMLRAVRFQHRLGFQIEPRTAELITGALPMLARITGERLKNEIALLLREDRPEEALLHLEKLDIPQHIQDGFRMDERLRHSFPLARQAQLSPDDLSQVYWHLIFFYLTPQQAQASAERLLLAQTMIHSLRQAAALRQMSDWMAQQIRPSQVVRQLEGYHEWAIRAALLGLEDERARQTLERYWEKWRYVRPFSTGNDLKALGLPAGKHYRRILEALRDARLEGQVSSAEEEAILRDRLVTEALQRP
ncbi:MAG: CBS domain-containing protein [Anaerolineae bacterium]|nr:CBS domain-containing protein [Anaerolineae bacterium]MDW8173568.1 CBS domain-containing protein [Anaerolineae bacterium]